MHRLELPPSLHRATFRIAALSFWGLSLVVMMSEYVGPAAGINFRVLWTITALAVAGGFVCWFWPWPDLPAHRFLPIVYAGVAMNAVSLFASGGIHTHHIPLLMVICVFSAALFSVRTAVVVLVLNTLVGVSPLLVQGWDPQYARMTIVMIASMVICSFVPSMVRQALRQQVLAAESQRQELERSYLATIEALATALDAKDRHTEAHSRETAALSRAVGRRLGLGDERLRFLEYAALLHDIGKIGVPGYVLNKPGPLDEEETAIMREHPVIGERIVAMVPFLHRIQAAVRAEHERWDGGGYPDGLRGEAIPIEARIIHACDALQAMASDRPYRPARPRDWILKEISEQAGQQFDPTVANALLEVVRSGEVVVAGTTEGNLHEDRPLPEAHSWTQYLDAIQQLGAQLSSVVDVPEVCQSIGRAITRLLPYDQCRVYLLDDDGRGLHPVYFSDTNRLEYQGVNAETLAIRVGEGITGWVAETKQGALVGDAERHPKAIHIPGTTESDESMLAVPVIFEDRLIGVIVIVRVGLNQYTGDHLRLMTILANQAAVSIQNARLIERLAATARTDPLTGLANRRAFEQELDQRLHGRAGEAFAVIMLDVDGLKTINDQLGHAAGDAVLKRVAAVLTERLREGDLVTRWGGDEFVLLLPGMDQVGALSMARRINGTLRDQDGRIGPISASIGIAVFPSDGTTADALLAAADRSMYLEKRQVA